MWTRSGRERMRESERMKEPHSQVVLSFRVRRSFSTKTSCVTRTRGREVTRKKGRSRRTKSGVTTRDARRPIPHPIPVRDA